MPAIPVLFKKLKENAKLPEMGSTYAAGYDVFACINEPTWIRPHETVKIGTGLAAAPPESFWLGIFARSGLAAKEGLRPANCVGVVDPDYRGEIIIALHNDFDIPKLIHSGDKIAQLILIPRYEMQIKEVNNLDETDRGSGGFGSTGIN